MSASKQRLLDRLRATKEAELKRLLRPTGRQYNSVLELMYGEGVSERVIQEFLRLTVNDEP